MKKILIGLGIFLGLITSRVEAQSVTDDLVGLGMKAELAEYIAAILPAGAVLGNNTSLKGRNAANSADISMLKVNTTDDTVLMSDSGDTIDFLIQADANRLLRFSGSSDTVLTLGYGDTGSQALQTFSIVSQTSDADDDTFLCLGGGGACGVTRGAYVTAAGNEETTAGDLVLASGSAVGATVTIDAAAAAGTIALQVASGTLFTVNATGELIGAGTATLGWAVKAGANTACTTTCTTPCVFGVNTAATEADIVACSDATADECLCAGAS